MTKKKEKKSGKQARREESCCQRERMGENAPTYSNLDKRECGGRFTIHDPEDPNNCERGDVAIEQGDDSDDNDGTLAEGGEAISGGSRDGACGGERSCDRK